MKTIRRRLSATVILSISWLAFFTGKSGANEQQPDLAARIDSAIQEAVKSGFSGEVLVQQRGQNLLHKAYGEIRGVKMTLATRYWLASLGKQFTSAAILKCQDKGLLILDDPIARFVSTAPADKKAITLRQLLSHQSGFAGGANSSEEATNRDEAVAKILSQPLTDRPGSRFIYSNDNYQLAAAIVEIVSKSRYEEFVSSELLTPAGLRDTGQVEKGRDPGVAPAKGETPKRLLERQWGQQGYYSTTQDLATWSHTLRAAKILSKRSVDEMFSPGVRITEGSSGLGWFIGATDKGITRIFDRGNEDFGPNCLIYIYPDTDTKIIVLTHAGNKNEDQSWSRAIHGEIERILFP